MVSQRTGVALALGRSLHESLVKLICRDARSNHGGNQVEGFARELVSAAGRTYLGGGSHTCLLFFIIHADPARGEELGVSLAYVRPHVHS